MDKEMLECIWDKLKELELRIEKIERR